MARQQLSGHCFLRLVFMDMRKSGLTRRGMLGASAGLAAGSGFSFPDLVLAEATTAATADHAPPASVALAERAVEGHKDAIHRINREVWELAELSVAETASAKVHLRELEAAEFKTVSVGTSGYPAAFVSEWTQGSGGPVVGFLPEYDALPDLANRTEPRQILTPNGNTNGHGCGHNSLGAGCTGAAIALKSMMQDGGIAGTIRVYGCSAEETEGVKVHMARDGLFDDVDAALAWHPAPFAGTGEVITAAIASVQLRFHGRTAHAGNTPWDGRSALKAAELFGTGVQYMREHVPTTNRMHYVFEMAGSAPNVVPAFAQIWMQLRAKDRDDLEALVEWAKQVAEGAALMTQTKQEFQIFHGMHDLLPNTPMIELVQAHMVARPPIWTDAEQVFAKACQAQMGLPEAGLVTSVIPPLPVTNVGGGTDLGDVSKIAPMGVFGWPTVGLGTSLHTWAITACGGISIGDRASLDTARILAGVGYDVMTDTDLRAAAKADLAKRLNGKPYVPIMPPEQKGPLRMPSWLHKVSGEEFVSVEIAG